MDDIRANTPYKSGFVAIAGQPNTGKSTLLNRLVGQKVSIITPKPQTTRNRILGIWHSESAQIAFVDTPGIHKGPKKLNQRMVQTALLTVAEADLVLALVDVKQGVEGNHHFIRNALKRVEAPVFLVINKIDLIPRLKILDLIAAYKDLYPFREIIPISALKGDNCDDLRNSVILCLPQGPPYYPEDMVTDHTERFAISELIREKLILLTRQEIPHVCAVVIDDMKDASGSNLVQIWATIVVEKESQKGIIIGDKGQMLKEIGMRARKEIEAFLGKSVYLEMWVKLVRNWRDDDMKLRQIGY